MLRELTGTGFAPELIDEQDDVICQEDLGDGEPVQDGTRFRQGAAQLLCTLWSHGIRHGDLTGRNIIVRGDRPIAIDFLQSRFRNAPGPDKRQLSDSYWLWSFVASVPSVLQGLPDSSRVVRRWLAILADLDVYSAARWEGSRLLDLGCHEGDFCAMAAGEGAHAVGIDRDEAAIERGRLLWGDVGLVSLRVEEILDRGEYRADIVLLLSTWQYVWKEYGRDRAVELLEAILLQSGVLYFETPLNGDGSGPAVLKSDEDVAKLLGSVGEPTALVTVPVAGRDASRTVWRVRSYEANGRP